MSKQFALDKPLIEASYLTAPNFRYRSILRYFYQQHQRRVLMVREEVYEKLKEIDGFEDYTLEHASDLDTLVGWKTHSRTGCQESTDY